MSLLAWLIVGLVAGLLAKYVVPAGPAGILGDIVVGVLGALLGGWLFNLLGYAGPSGVNLYSIFVAFIGAVILLAILRAVNRRTI
jgi:uncharacterized membrane protein YeaQ/YmgE (transglycosylase-associated protein family)